MHLKTTFLISSQKNQLSLEELMKKALAEAPTKESYDTMRASLEQIIKKQKNNKNE